MTKQEVLALLDDAIGAFDSRLSAYTFDTIEDILHEARLPFQWSAASGITKAALLIKDADFVIKIPFTHAFQEEDYDDAVYAWEEQNDDTAPEPDASDDKWYWEFEAADSIPNVTGLYGPKWDYCNCEVNTYELACQRGLGQYFAEESLLGYIGDHPIYTQVRCTPMSDIEVNYASDEYKQKKRISDSICKELDVYNFNSVWIADFITFYGEKELERLDLFLREYDINDLRDCNIGYLDGAPILFDYSSYREWD